MYEAPWEQRCGTLGDLHAYGRQSGSSLGACKSFPPDGQVVHLFSHGDNVRRTQGYLHANERQAWSSLGAGWSSPLGG